ncbi:MAG: response regulator, partial [Flavobacteriales bacterium]|nr:response regulator [Flavobacteriales bacterium]
MTSPLNILMIEDNPDDQQFFRDLFSESSLGQFNLHLTDRLKDGKEYLRKHAIDVLLLDLSLPDSFELEGFIEIKEEFPHLPVIILTGMSDFKMAVKAIQFGAQDYLEKWRYDDYLMAKSIRYALERQKLLLEREKVSNQLMNSLKMLDVVNVELKELNEQLEEKVRKR